MKLMLVLTQVVVEVEVKVELTASPVGGWTKTKLMLISTQGEVVVEVELGKKQKVIKIIDQ